MASSRPAAARRLSLGAIAGPVLLVFGGLWFVVALSSVRAGELGVTRQGDPVVEGRRFPKTLVDPSGKRTIVPAPPRRIVSLMLGADEVLTALVEPERIAGVSRFADSPEMSTCVDRVPVHAARIRGADPEPILGLEPDVVFAAGYTLDSAVRILGGAGVPVVRFASYRSFDDVAKNLLVFGEILGRRERAAELVTEMRGRLAGIEASVTGRPRPRVLYYSPVGYTTGKDTLVNEKIRIAGGENVIAGIGLSGPKHLSVDLMVALDPDVVVVPRWSADVDPGAALRADPLWKDVAAVREGRVYSLDAKWLTSVSQDGVRGVEELARVLHPEAFGA